MLEIVDVNGKKRDALSVKRITHQVSDAVNGGIATTKEYVEVEIIGKTGRRWTEWYPLEQFLTMNPKVKVR